MVKVSSSITYDGCCLDCIRQQTAKIKATKYDRLVEYKKELDKMTAKQHIIYTTWKLASDSYKALDYQEAIIVHEQAQAKIQANKLENKASALKKHSIKETSTNDLVMKILANLTPEQQENVLANMRAKTSQGDY
jgi:hypothetical protein